MKKFTKTVYKKDTKGKIRETTVSAIDGIITQESGLVGGKFTIHTTEAKPKNEGKINSTTSEEQAIIEAKAKITKKLKEGYFNTMKEAENEKIIMPMLAKVFEKEAHKIDWSTAYVQPKLDGMRCLGVKGNKISRKNTPIDTMDHIKYSDTKDLIYDGELYAHGRSFQENMKLIKKFRPESTEVKHHLYDIVSDKPFSERIEILSELAINFTNCEIVETYKVNSLEDVKNFHKQFIGEGYEGTMIRWGNEGYKVNGRSSNLLKYKEFIDKTYKVVDVVPSDKNPKQGVVHCKMPNGAEFNGVTFGCGMKFSHKDREEILTNKKKYIGQTAEIRFFEFTDDGLPRFPVCVGFRLDK